MRTSFANGPWATDDNPDTNNQPGGGAKGDARTGELKVPPSAPKK